MILKTMNRLFRKSYTIKSKIKRIMKNIKFLPLIFLFAVVISCNQQRQSESIDLEVPVSVEDIRLQSIRQFITTTGTVRATSEVLLNSEMTGNYFLLNNPATGRPFKLGDRVNKGQTIIRFENDEYVNNL